MQEPLRGPSELGGPMIQSWVSHPGHGPGHRTIKSASIQKPSDVHSHTSRGNEQGKSNYSRLALHHSVLTIQPLDATYTVVKSLLVIKATRHFRIKMIDRHCSLPSNSYTSFFSTSPARLNRNEEPIDPHSCSDCRKRFRG